MRRALSMAVACALAATAGRAAPPADPFVETVLSVSVNGQPESQTLVVRRDSDGALLLRATDLRLLRIRTPPRGGLQLNGERYYRFGVGDGAEVVYDDATQSVALTLPAGAFVPTRGSAVAAAVPRPVQASLGAFVNYELSLQHTDRLQSGAFLESGLFGRRGVLTSALVLRGERGAGSSTRLDTTFTRDLPERLASLRLGDAISASGAWGRSLRFGGVQYGTNFATQPTLVTTPLLAASGEAVVPSTVDVFVNGQRVAGAEVPPGPFTIDGVPAVNGAGQMQVVVTDALGREQVLSQPFYSGSSLLGAGLEEYSLELGAIREDYGARSFEYGRWMAAGTLRRGLSDRFTGEVHAELDGGGTHAVGVDGAWQLGDWGVVAATAAAGGDDAGNGWLAGLGLERDGPRMSLYARAQYASEGFAQFGDRELESRPRLLGLASLGWNLLRWGSLQFAYGVQTFWSAPSIATYGLSYSLSIASVGFLSLFASHSDSDDSRSEAMISFTVPLGSRRSSTTSLRYAPDDTAQRELEATTSLQQNAPLGTGFGYRATLATSQDRDLGLTWQGDHGVLSAEYARRAGSDGWRAGALGGVALTSVGAMTSRPLDQSFAVVQVADYPGVPVYLDNQPVARTDAQGRALLPNLRPYEANRVSLDAATLPLDASLATSSVTVTPAYRSGAVVRFPVTRVRAATFRLVQSDGTPVPAGARVEAGGRSVPVARDGFVYLTNAGSRLEAAAQWPGRRCRFVVDRGQTEDPLPDLGTLECRDPE